MWTFRSFALWGPLQPISCVVRTASANQRSGNIRVAGWSDGNPSPYIHPLLNWYNDWHDQIEHSFCMFPTIFLLLKILTNQQLWKVWDDVTMPNVLSMTACRRFLLFLFLNRNAAFVVFAMLKHGSFQSRFLSMAICRYLLWSMLLKMCYISAALTKLHRYSTR